MDFIKEHKLIILLLIILLLGGLFRFWGLKSTPPGLYPDEAINGMDAITSGVESCNLRTFYSENNGREGLLIWLISLSFGLFGISVWSLRLVSAIIGFFTILGLFLLAKELFNEKIALLSSFFLAVSFWHTNFSRIGFRAIFVPFLMCFSFYFLFRGIKNKKVGNFIIAGIFFGLGFYTYIAFRAAVLLLGILVLMKMWSYWQKNKSSKKWSLRKNYIKDGWWRWDVFFIVILIVVLPLAIHFYRQPQDFMGRAGDVSIFNSQQPLKEFVLGTVKNLGAFNIRGDWNWRHNYAGAPLLAWTVGILFLIGLIITIKINLLWARGALSRRRRTASGHGSGRRRRPGSEQLSAAKFHAGEFCVAEKCPSRQHYQTYIFLLSWFVIMLLPAILTTGAPHALRTIGIIPIVYIFAALGFVWLSDLLVKKADKTLAAVFLAVLLIHPVYANFNQYFCRWANDPDVAGAFEQNLVETGNYINNLPEESRIFLITNGSPWDVPVPYPDGLPMPAQTIMFIERTRLQHKVQYGGQGTIYLKPEQIDKISVDNIKTIIILMRPDEILLDQLTSRWPEGKIKKTNGVWALMIN